MKPKSSGPLRWRPRGGLLHAAVCLWNGASGAESTESVGWKLTSLFRKSKGKAATVHQLIQGEITFSS